MTGARLAGWLRSPALHMLLLGGLLFGFGELRGGISGAGKPRIEIPAHRLEAMLQEFVADTGQRPSPEQWRQMVEMQIDDELLFQYALTLGMQENSAAQARLAQIAQFVEANPHEATEAENARAAVRLGLHEGDLVVRRILVDSARRLIRSVVLVQQPAPEAVAEHYAANAAAYTRPPRVRLVQVAINGFKWPDTEGRARQLLQRIENEHLGVAEALALGDESPLPVRLPLQPAKSLESQFGAEFAAAVIGLPAGRWSGPIASLYGHHLVYVEERKEAELQPLDAVRRTVEQQVLAKLADDWLQLRLQELRGEFEIVVPGGTT